jgi:hypothetical protein
MKYIPRYRNRGRYLSLTNIGLYIHRLHGSTVEVMISYLVPKTYPRAQHRGTLNTYSFLNCCCRQHSSIHRPCLHIARPPAPTSARCRPAPPTSTRLHPSPGRLDVLPDWHGPPPPVKVFFT